LVVLAAILWSAFPIRNGEDAMNAVVRLLGVVLLWPGLVAAQTDRPITMVSPFPNPGGGSGRVFAEVLGRELGQPVVLMQRDGAAGMVGMRVLATSAPDGLTIAYTAMTPLVVQPHVVRDLGYRPEAIPAICNVAENVAALVVRADSPMRTVADVVAAATETAARSTRPA
jgi:tripartite-type tricarboxylate transporter receptor subunit TctC